VTGVSGVTGLSARLVVRRPAFELRLDLEVGAGEVVALVGPNGAGKSTALRALAGLLPLADGFLDLDGRRLAEPAEGVHVPAHARGVGVVFQDYLLFPHLSVLDNVAFGPRSTGQRTGPARLLARRWLTEVGALELADRRPGALSGGQAQRVALARALAAEPRLLLLDEPLAALDVRAAPVLRQVLRRVLADRAAIIVTHDLLDALVLADRVVVIDAGRVVESGPTADVIRHPRTPFTARIAGLNLIRGSAQDHSVRQPDGRTIEGLPLAPLVRGEAAIAVFAPSAVSVFVQPPHGSPRNTIEVTITELEPRDDQVRVRAVAAGGQTYTADVTAPAVSELALYPGSVVHFSLKASAVTIYPA
jgi:molybdate transport system ATP-binding protein